MAEYTVEEFEQRMTSLGEAYGHDCAAALDVCRPLVIDGIRDNFAGSHDSQGNAWPLRKDPIPQHPLLILTGQLQEAATGGGPAHVDRVEDCNTLVIGVDKSAGDHSGGIPGAAVHQYGYSPRNIVARPYLGISEAVQSHCVDALQPWAAQWVTSFLAA